MSTALVSGANGFIGAHLVRHLIDRGFTVRGLVRPTSNLTALAGLPVELFVGDLRDQASLEAAATGVDYVFHLGAELMVTSKAAFDATNTHGTEKLLMAALAGSPQLQRFLFVSSQAAAGPGPNAEAYDETKPTEPISWYGQSKQRAEEIVRNYGDRLPVTIVRPSSVYGERETDISQLYPLVACHLQPRLGLRTRHLVAIYVGDLVEGIVAAAESPASKGETYFLNHRQQLKGSGLVKAAGKALGKSWGLPLPAPSFLIGLAAPPMELLYHFTRNRPPLTRDKAREVRQRFWVADPSKAERDFGWRAQHDIEAGMQSTVQAWKKSEDDLVADAGDSETGSWIKSVLVGVLLGTMIEMTSKIGGFYAFTPPAGIFVIIFGAFGLALGSLAHFLRRQCPMVQLLVGWVVAGAAEAANVAAILPGLSWTFAPGWPLGIDDPWLRSVVLGAAGGVFILAVGAIMRAMYRRRLRMG